MSIIRGAPQPGQRAALLSLGAVRRAQIEASREARKLQTMANRGVPLTDGRANMATARIIDYDNAPLRPSAERRRCWRDGTAKSGPCRGDNPPKGRAP
jgi:iron(III) transport system substrate-binding protein